MSQLTMYVDIIIIGAGPAGVMAAVQLARANLKVALFEANKVGGLLHAANLVENLSGFPKPIPGPQICGLLNQHLARLEINPIYESVQKVSWCDQKFEVQTSAQTICSKYLIAASGTKPKSLPLAVPEQAKKRVHQEIYQLLSATNKTIAIIGGGDASFDYALNLTTNNKVDIFCRTQPSCLPLLFDRCQKQNNITIRQNVNLEQILPQEKGLELKLKSGHETSSFQADEVLFAIGREPNLAYLKPLADQTLIKLMTKKKLFLVGDLKNGILRQATIAAGDGMRAAMEIIYQIVIPA
ncbi:MAG: NAD(P)/FAD-dependent oxidoreductase [Pseudomonadota bacterium]